MIDCAGMPGDWDGDHGSEAISQPINLSTALGCSACFHINIQKTFYKRLKGNLLLEGFLRLQDIIMNFDMFHQVFYMLILRICLSTCLHFSSLQIQLFLGLVKSIS